MTGRATFAVCLHALTVAAYAQAPVPIATAQIKDIQIPKLSSRPRLEQFLNGASPT
jgi:hypothetical protein